MFQWLNGESVLLVLRFKSRLLSIQILLKIGDDLFWRICDFSQPFLIMLKSSYTKFVELIYVTVTKQLIVQNDVLSLKNVDFPAKLLVRKPFNPTWCANWCIDLLSLSDLISMSEEESLYHSECLIYWVRWLAFQCHDCYDAALFSEADDMWELTKA